MFTPKRNRCCKSSGLHVNGKESGYFKESIFKFFLEKLEGRFYNKDLSFLTEVLTLQILLKEKNNTLYFTL